MWGFNICKRAGDIRGKAQWISVSSNIQHLTTYLSFRRSLGRTELGGMASLAQSRSGQVNCCSSRTSNILLGGRIPYVLSTQYNERERAVLAKAVQVCER